MLAPDAASQPSSCAIERKACGDAAARRCRCALLAAKTTRRLARPRLPPASRPLPPRVTPPYQQ